MKSIKSTLHSGGEGQNTRGAKFSNSYGQGCSLAFVLTFVADNVQVNASFAFALANVYRLFVNNKLGRGGFPDTVMTGLNYFNLIKKLFFHFFSSFPCLRFAIYTYRYGNIVVLGLSILERPKMQWKVKIRRFLAGITCIMMAQLKEKADKL